MMLKIKTVFLVVFFANSLLAQQSGLLCSDERYEKIPLLPTYSGTKYNEIPLRVSLKKYCPVPGDQKQMGSCVGWAVGYGAYTMLQAQREEITDPSTITERAYSAAFIYNQIKLKQDDCDAGAYIEDGLELLKTTGDCLEQSFSYKDLDCQATPNSKLLAEAKRFCIQDYASVFELNEAPKRKVAKACKILATETPIVVGIAITPDFWEIKPGTQLWTPSADNTPTSHHAMVLVGYDNVEKQFELLNSFGTSWGRNGFIRIKYDDFERLCRYAYVLMPKLSNKNEAPELLVNDNDPVLSGEFVFRKPAGYLTTTDGDEIPFFEEITTRWDSTDGVYATQKSFFEVGEVFQLIARQIPRGCYVYVFSENQEGIVNLHFPKVVSTGRTASFVLEKTAEIIIPDEATALQLSKPGIDYLCVIYSNSPIHDIEERIKALQKNENLLPNRVFEVFKDIVIPAGRVRYSERQMAFSALPQSNLKQIAVPVILRVEAK
ncbi:MAG: C1 family peptidase [Saprospiraceae bacterium]|nr:C1 family peptidase [Saprospiraceae bacterium]